MAQSLETGLAEDKDPADSVKNPPDLLAFCFPVQTFVWRRGGGDCSEPEREQLATPPPFVSPFDPGYIQPGKNTKGNITGSIVSQQHCFWGGRGAFTSQLLPSCVFYACGRGRGRE